MLRDVTRTRRVGVRCVAIVGSVLLWTLTAGAAAQEARLVAQQHFDEGMAAFESERFADAALSFREAYAALPSPNSRLMLARSLERDGRLGEAFSELEFAVREATDRAALDERFQRTLEAATSERDALAPRVGWLTVQLRGELAEGDITLDGRSFPLSVVGVRVPVTPGPVQVQLRAPDRPEVSESVVLEAGDEVTVTLVVPPATVVTEEAPPASIASSPAIAPWVIAGIGVIGLGAAVGLGVHADGLHAGAVVAPDMERAFALQGSAVDFALVTNVTLAIAGGVLLLGTSWGIVDLATLSSGEAR